MGMYSEMADSPKRYGQFCRICFTLGNRAKDDDFLNYDVQQLHMSFKGTPCFLPKTKREGGGVFPLQAGQ